MPPSAEAGIEKLCERASAAAWAVAASVQAPSSSAPYSAARCAVTVAAACSGLEKPTEALRSVSERETERTERSAGKASCETVAASTSRRLCQSP